MKFLQNIGERSRIKKSSRAQACREQALSTGRTFRLRKDTQIWERTWVSLRPRRNQGTSGVSKQASLPLARPPRRSTRRVAWHFPWKYYGPSCSSTLTSSTITNSSETSLKLHYKDIIDIGELWYYKNDAVQFVEKFARKTIRVLSPFSPRERRAEALRNERTIARIKRTYVGGAFTRVPPPYRGIDVGMRGDARTSSVTHLNLEPMIAAKKKQALRMFLTSIRHRTTWQRRTPVIREFFSFQERREPCRVSHARTHTHARAVGVLASCRATATYENPRRSSTTPPPPPPPSYTRNGEKKTTGRGKSPPATREIEARIGAEVYIYIHMW